MDEAISGVDDTQKNLAKFEKALIAQLIMALGFVALAITTHIKVTYQRPVTGKGFTDRTSLLRRSVTHKIIQRNGRIEVWIFASGGAPGDEGYAQYVEFVAGGKYAFMLPGFLDMERKIIPLILKEMKRHGLVIAA